MRRRPVTIIAAAALGGVLLLGQFGCATGPHRPSQGPLPPLVRPDGGRQSMVLNHRAMRRLPLAPRTATRRPWYATRNDHPRAIILGNAGPTIQTSETRTYDRLGSFNGHVVDHYRRRTYRTRYRETVH